MLFKIIPCFKDSKVVHFSFISFIVISYFFDIIISFESFKLKLSISNAFIKLS